MGRLLDADVYAFDPLSVPFIAVAAGMLWLLVYLLLTRGHPLLRMTLLAAVIAGILFFGVQAAALSCTDLETAKSLYKVAVAPVSLFGPALFALVLGAGDRLQPHRLLLAIAILAALASSAITLMTDLVVDRMWVTAWGIPFFRAGPLNPVHVGVMIGWVVAGMVLAARGMRSERRNLERGRYRRVGIILVMAPLAATDALLASGIGVYPLSWLPALVVVVVAIQSARSGDLIRRRGRDWATLWEALVVAGLAVVSFAAFSLVSGAGKIALVAVAVALLAAAQLGVAAIRRRAKRRVGGVAANLEREIDDFTERAERSRDERDLAVTARELLRDRFRFDGGRLLEVDGGELVEVGTGDDDPRRFPFDARVKAWLLANRAPLLVERLDAMPLGGLRAPIVRFLDGLHAGLALPLVDRETLVGLFVTDEHDGERPVDDAELQVLSRIQHAIARAFTYLRLYREAEQRVEVAREVEIAAAVQHARAPGEERRTTAGCDVVSYYQPAGQFGGDWCVSSELPDGRLLVVIGDVTGHGVPAALVTAAVEGGCETAQRMLGAGFNVFDMLQLLNRSVAEIGKARYLMSCFAAAIDPDGMTVTFANAGHPFPYRCRPTGDDGRAELRALVSRGTPLGIEAQPQLAVSQLELQPGDALVFYTDALVESENDRGQRYGERRLQRALRTRLFRAADSPCRAILDDAHGFYGDVPIREDITLVCVRIGRS